MRVSGDARVALDLGDDGGDLGGAEIERRDQPGGRDAHAASWRTTTCPAKRASSSAQRASVTLEILLDRQSPPE